MYCLWYKILPTLKGLPLKMQVRAQPVPNALLEKDVVLLRLVVFVFIYHIYVIIGIYYGSQFKNLQIFNQIPLYMQVHLLAQPVPNASLAKDVILLEPVVRILIPSVFEVICIKKWKGVLYLNVLGMYCWCLGK